MFSVEFKRERDSFCLIFKVRHRIEELERKFLSTRDCQQLTRSEKWNKIVFATGEFYERNIELCSFRSTITVDPTLFIKSICELYGDFSDPAARILGFAVPSDKPDIEAMLHHLRLDPAKSRIETVEIILTPIGLPPFTQPPA